MNPPPGLRHLASKRSFNLTPAPCCFHIIKSFALLIKDDCIESEKHIRKVGEENELFCPEEVDHRATKQQRQD
jgi:hypothetical protein